MKLKDINVRSIRGSLIVETLPLVRVLHLNTYMIFFIRNWSKRNWGYRGQNFTKLRDYITPTLRNWSVANLRNFIIGVYEIHNFGINSSPNVTKVLY